MKNTIKKFGLGELFCGPGGLALGAMCANISDPEYRIVHQWANSTLDRYLFTSLKVH